MWRKDASIEARHALRRAHDVGEADAELVIDDDDLAMCDQRAVHEHVHGLAGESIELDYRSLIELEQFAHAHARTAHFEREGDGHVEDHVEADLAAVGRLRRAAREIVEACTLRRLRRRGAACGGRARSGSGFAGLFAHVGFLEDFPGVMRSVMRSALKPRDAPKRARNRGVPPETTVMVSCSSVGMTSPGLSASSSPSLSGSLTSAERSSI